jgi:hypothetical protein
VTLPSLFGENDFVHLKTPRMNVTHRFALPVTYTGDHKNVSRAATAAGVGGVTAAGNAKAGVTGEACPLKSPRTV